MEPDYDGMLDDLDACGKLTDWEVEFVDSMLQRREANADWADYLTERQREVLSKIHDKRCQ